MIQTDYLVIGSGIAGLSFALRAAEHGTVALIAKRELSGTATNVAQGGVAAVWSSDDTFEEHVQDTLTAGAGLCRRDIVEGVVREGPDRVRELIDWGVPFTVSQTNGDDFELGLEGGHSRRRILHAGDVTGAEIQKTLLAKIADHPRIKVYENHCAVDLITTGKIRRRFAGAEERCWGAYVLDVAAGRVLTFLATVTVLATGGAGKIYRYTSNPDIATGDGIAMAYRCGAVIANMEFFQFHPTCLYHPQAKSFLISEAVRGEGAVLRLKNGQSFMEKYHPSRELAPRDVVTRAIDHELKARGDEFVYLDITHKKSDFLKRRFPNIYRTCLEFGIDMTKEPIPVVPAAHYCCGGVLTDDKAQTTVSHLFAVGETACTGLHGANRLASNSLLEALVFADRAARASRELAGKPGAAPAVPSWDAGQAKNSDEMVVVSQNWEEIRHFMWNYVGIVRSDRRLDRALRRIALLQKEIADYYWNFVITSDLIELRNIATVAELVVRSARKRRESRGLHYTIDYPAAPGTAGKDTRLSRFKAVRA